MALNIFIYSKCSLDYDKSMIRNSKGCIVHPAGIGKTCEAFQPWPFSHRHLPHLHIAQSAFQTTAQHGGCIPQTCQQPTLGYSKVNVLFKIYGFKRRRLKKKRPVKVWSCKNISACRSCAGEKKKNSWCAEECSHCRMYIYIYIFCADVNVTFFKKKCCITPTAIGLKYIYIHIFIQIQLPL